MAAPGVLFVCVANAARSQLAEGLARAQFGERLRIYSAGTSPAAAVDPLAIAAMAEAKLDISAQTPKPVESIDPAEIDLVVILDDTACPRTLVTARQLRWQIPDPERGERKLHPFRIARRMIRARLAGVEPALATPPRTQIRPVEREAEIHQPDVLYVVEAWLDGVRVGVAGFEQHDDRGTIDPLEVESAHRGHGIGAALVADRIAFASSNLQVGCASISITVGSASDYDGPRFVELYKTTNTRIEEDIKAELAAHGTLVPPWVKFPDIPRRSIGWRMGSGEWYLWMWGRWWEGLSVDEKTAYRARWEAPPTWSDWLVLP